MNYLAGGFVTGLVLAQLCAGNGIAFAQPPAQLPPSRPAWCPASPSAAVDGFPVRLSAVSAKIARGETIIVVAVGSSSTEGSDLPDKALAYPTHLERQLTARLGSGLVKVLNKGRGGETMTETVARFLADVGAEKPDLVVWQLGVNDVVRGNDMAISERNIEDGMAALKTMGTPVVLMDMQLAPRVTASPVLPVMRALLKSAALKHEALLWSRFELMETIIKTGDAQLTELIKPDELHMTVAMHVCTGAVLGDMIASNVSPRAVPELVSAKTP